MTSHVEQQIRARIAAAAAKRRRRRAQRREFAEARERGLEARHAAKLRHLDAHGQDNQPPTAA